MTSVRRYRSFAGLRRNRRFVSRSAWSGPEGPHSVPRAGLWWRQWHNLAGLLPRAMIPG